MSQRKTISVFIVRLKKKHMRFKIENRTFQQMEKFIYRNWTFKITVNRPVGLEK